LIQIVHLLLRFLVPSLLVLVNFKYESLHLKYFIKEIQVCNYKSYGRLTGGLAGVSVNNCLRDSLVPPPAALAIRTTSTALGSKTCL